MSQETLDLISKRFIAYCWRLGIGPVEESFKVDENGFSILVSLGIGSDEKKGFSTWEYLPGTCKTHVALFYSDVHNPLVTEHNRLTKYWFEGYKVPTEEEIDKLFFKS